MEDLRLAPRVIRSEMAKRMFSQSGVPDSQRKTLWLLCTAELFAMTPWFAGSTVVSQLQGAWHADRATAAWVTIAVQLGFVAGALLSATLNLPDVFSAPRIFVMSSLLAALANALFAWVAADHMRTGIVLRFATGMLLAGVYPTGMKIMASWFRNGRGLALGALVGALTLGSALPHAIYATGQLPWHGVILSASGLTLVASVIVWAFVKEGPYLLPNPPFNLSQVGEIVRNRRLRLANFGYLGHMWELYSMWTWIAVIFAIPSAQAASRQWREAASFCAIAAGAVGCVTAGMFADRIGDSAQGADNSARIAARARVTIVCMTASGACCLLAAGLVQHFTALVAVSMIWGIAIVADSAQFSAIVSEVSDQRYVGTALTLQTALGFLLTTFSIRAFSSIAARWGWSWAIVSLAAGPFLGCLAMWRLQHRSASTTPG
jgi:MFS family permease